MCLTSWGETQRATRGEREIKAEKRQKTKDVFKQSKTQTPAQVSQSQGNCAAGEADA